MGWPKGMKRKGHVNKDGSVHSTRGKKTARVKAPKITAENLNTIFPPVARKRGRPKKGEESIERWTTKLTNKGQEPCPACSFPEAYAGYCDECGWTAETKVGRVT